MNHLEIKKLTRILFLSLLFLLPALSVKAEVCGVTGTCADASVCSIILDGGIHDSECALNGTIVCCDPNGLPDDQASANDSDDSQQNAPNYQEGSAGGFLLLKGHLVPCGRQSDDPATPNNETESCTLCHFFLLFKNIFDLILSLIIVTSILFITVGGVVYIVSMGNPRLTGIAKGIITKTLIGFALMLVGWLLVFTLLNFLSAGDMIGKGTDSWFEFTCDTNSNFE